MGHRGPPRPPPAPPPTRTVRDAPCIDGGPLLLIAAIIFVLILVAR